MRAKSHSCRPLGVDEMIRVSDETIDAPKALAAFERDMSDAGAIVSFTGQVRPQSASGEVSTLFLQAYSLMTESGIESALAEAQRRWPLSGVHILHRTGEMRAGETIVFVATASKHRRAAFEAADFLMDYLKTEAVFWKKETTPDGATWIEPRQGDYQDAARWQTEKVE